jgi:TolB-like protein
VPEPSLPPGTVIGRFELQHEIGRGGFGVVYEARDTALGRSVAFKLVRGGKRMDLQRERLLREAEAAARLSHPNVVTLHDLGTSEHGPYLVLELLRGETLAEVIRRGPAGAREAVDTAMQIATGLAHAHAAGVVHGDITPGNVFVCADGRVKLLDLGLARLFGSPESAGGTRGYVAPELRTGAPSSERSDVYALGVVLFRMITGHMPYRADDDRERPRLRLARTPVLADAIERMLASDPGDRPRDAGEALAALKVAYEEVARGPRSATRWTRSRLALMLGSAIVVAVGAGLLLRGRGDSGGGSSAPVSLAVLPFVDRSPGRDQGYLAEGMADQLRLALGRVDGLRVIGRTSSTSLSNGASLAAAAQTLGVTRVLVGGTRRVGDRLEVDAELRDAEGNLLWGHTYEKPMTDLFSVQSEVTSAVLVALAVQPPSAKPSPPTALKPDAETYTEYLKGRQHYYRGTPDGWRLARESYERAVELDPTYAPAWASLAGILHVIALGVGTSSDAESRALRQRALEVADKAVMLAPDLPEARSARGFILGFLTHDWPRAMADFNHALAVEPNNVDTLRRYSHLVAALGRTDEAITAAEKAADRDPLDSKCWVTLSGLYVAKGDFARAERAARRALAVAPEGAGTLALGYALLLEGRYTEALAPLARAPEFYRLAGTAMAEHSLGHSDGSHAALAALTTQHAHDAALFIAQVHAWKNESDLAFSWLDRALANGEESVAGIRYDPILPRLRHDARYAALLRALHLPCD